MIFGKRNRTLKVGIFLIAPIIVVTFLITLIDKDDKTAYMISTKERKYDKQRKLPYGEYGRSAFFLNPIKDAGLNTYNYKAYISDHISVRRKLPDVRYTWCMEPDRFLKVLPQTSIIICFRNEAWSVLLRTVHSVLDRSPPHLVKEIILVDDFSEYDDLKQPLDNYMSSFPNVRIVRVNHRHGLVRARLLGTKLATAPVLTFLDSHCECTAGWLEPLLDRIARNSTTVVYPSIDIISPLTFQYINDPSYDMYTGGFNWELRFDYYRLLSLRRYTHKHRAEPWQSPTMPGGLFAIDKEFFKRLGTYDEEYNIWGAEHLELSFKTWMCGGTLELIPCSHVGHIYRLYLYMDDYKTQLTRNNVRLAEVWLDDYAKYFYKSQQEKVDFGDVSVRKALRKKLGCKSFEWYLKNVFPECFIPDEAVSKGKILNRASNMCLGYDVSKKRVYLEPCGTQNLSSQFLLYSKRGEIRLKDSISCLTYEENIVFQNCRLEMGSQLWLYDPITQLIVHYYSNKCLAFSEKVKQRNPVMVTCNAQYNHQKWMLQNYRVDRMDPYLLKEASEIEKMISGKEKKF